MTKKDYQKFADMLATTYDVWGDSPDNWILINFVAENIMQIFRDDNPRFNATKFRKAVAKGCK